MKARILVFFCLIFGLAAIAQTAPPSQKVAPDSVNAPITKAAPATRAAAHAPVAPAKAQAHGKRDPFISPVREGGPAGGPNCTVGKKCLAIDTIQLRGIVRAQSGPIAVVESSTRKVTYFLRESDSVFNGYVVKITADSVMFRENVMDRTGKQSTREVVKRVSAPPV
jgi:Tfp pilus assembly protein PilP